MVRQGSLAALAVATLVPVFVACSKDKPAENPPNQMAQGQPPPGGYPPGYPGAPPGQQPGQYPQGQYPQGTTPPPGTMPPGQTPPPGTAPAGSGSAAPGDLNSLLAGIASAIPGVFAPPGGGTGDVAEAGIKAQAMRFAPGMQPDGQMLKQQLQAGQHVEMMVPMSKGKCYTVVAFSVPGGVTDLDLNMMSPLSLPPYTQVFATDNMATGNPVLFPNQNKSCPVSPINLQYKLDVHAKAGGGMVLVQVYSANQ
jgi:hypothetical protein